MSDHHHLVVTDERGVLPEFLRELHRSVAKALNAAHGECENLWSVEPCSAITLGDSSDVLSMIAYVVTNPVTAGLVDRPSAWPGFIAWNVSAERVLRPTSYFSDVGASPDDLVLRFVRPHTAARRGWRKRIRVEIRRRIRGTKHALRVAGRKFAGRAKVMSVPRSTRARSREPRTASVPKIAARDIERREALFEQLRTFHLAHAEAKRQWCLGCREVPFPFGTWWMRVHHGASAHSQPPS